MEYSGEEENEKEEALGMQEDTPISPVSVDTPNENVHFMVTDTSTSTSAQKIKAIKRRNICFFYMHFCPGTMTTHAESINSDLQRGLD